MFAAIMPFLGKAASMLLSGAKGLGSSVLSGLGGGEGIGSLLGQAAGSLLGGGSSTDTSGQQQAPIQPQNQFIPPTMMASRQMPSYGNMINTMLQKQRGF